jgi:lipopolysaccharide/colanic/teichoic acid biosynthesis glycosyltransferase
MAPPDGLASVLQPPDVDPWAGDRRTGKHSKAHRRVELYLLMAGAELASLILGFGLASAIRPIDGHMPHLPALLMVLALIYSGVAFQLGAYGVDALRRWTWGLRRALTALFLASLVIFAVAFAWRLNTDFSRGFFLLGMALSAGGIGVTRHLAYRLSLHRLPDGPVEIVVIADQPRALAVVGNSIIDARLLRSACDLDCPESLDRLGRAICHADRVLLACAIEDRERWVAALKGTGLDVELMLPEFEALGVLSIDRHQGRLTACVAKGQLALRERVLKRAFDLAAVLWLLPLLLLTLTVVSLLIRLNDGGPVFFVQRRIGQGNRFFNLYKFRTMRVDGLDSDGARSTSRGDARVTRVGAWLRRTSIDELPQLINVLMGSMSIVGPRPHALGSTAEDQLFWNVDQRYWLRHAAKPGLTGLAQVRGFRGATDSRAAIVNRIQADLEYLASWTLWRDIRILAATVGVIAHPNAF